MGNIFFKQIALFIYENKLFMNCVFYFNISITTCTLLLHYNTVFVDLSFCNRLFEQFFNLSNKSNFEY